VPQGTYFVCADAAPLLGAAGAGAAPLIDGSGFARGLPERAGVACVPISAFCREGSATAEALSSWVRFTFVKDEQTLRTAIDRLQGMRG
jgi:N-succinyldiaminopimelate aminotransferase